MRQSFWSLIVLCLLVAGPAYAIDPGEQLADPVLEARARALSQELRCLVCQNQSIDGSDAPLARDLRLLVRDRLTAGDSDEQVLDYIVARYGEFVLLRPRFYVQTWVLWIAPFALLLVGGIAVVAVFKRSKLPEEQATPLTAVEKARLKEIVNGCDGAPD